MVCFPNAKINLGLNIIEKRPDGFHNIETIFYPIALTDILEILPNSESGITEMEITGMNVPGNSEDNLCTKAYKLLEKEFHLPPVRIILHKIIPMGAGLGGGSSDGAYTLITLNNMFELGLSEEQLLYFASMLGSDCAFFIRNKPSVGLGKGNELNDIDLSLKGTFLILIKPNVHIGTAEAYAGVVPHKSLNAVGSTVLQPIINWKNCLENDFEKSIFPKHPEIKWIKDELYRNGAVYASMTGSGAAVYGIFDSEPDLKDSFTNCFFWKGEF
jgi:4-diphosphocytidyl-2-C-methyl-D-erythritol kinase